MCLGVMYGVKGKCGGDQQCMQRSHEISVGRQDPAMPLNTHEEGAATALRIEVEELRTERSCDDV